MKKIALVFVLAVLLPSLVLAWLAVRSLNDQQFLLERQQSLLDQRVTDSLAQNISDSLAQRLQEFAAQVESMAASGDTKTLSQQFDEQLRKNWPLAEVGFCVNTSGKIFSPSPNERPEAQMFRLDNSGFLGNREPVEVYSAPNLGNGFGNNNGNVFANNARIQSQQYSVVLNSSDSDSSTKDQIRQQNAPSSFSRNSLGGFGGGGGSAASGRVQGQVLASAPANEAQTETVPQQALALSPAQPAADSIAIQNASKLNYKAAQNRTVTPQNMLSSIQPAEKSLSKDQAADVEFNLSKVVPAEAEFAQIIGDQSDGMLARFLQNKLKLMFWHRLNAQPDLIFGAQLDLNRIVDGFRNLVQPDRDLQNEICLAVLDDNAKPVVVSSANFSANWKRPFVATEIGDALPHWEVAAYLINPAALTQAAHTARLTLGLLVAVLVFAIGVGSWLVVRSLNAELKLARQKTDFVSNVSHELKTPLTSIRMFSELLAENRVSDAAKQKSYLQIITAEAARLTRLINNVLDFSRMERGEKKYNFTSCDLTEIVRSTCETFRPHLETSGFKLNCEFSEIKIAVRGDADALAQILVNLLSNAEKYSGEKKEIEIQLAQKQSPLPHAEIKVLDRGFGVPRGSEEKIFEKFYRAHDSLSSGIQGSGLGLTIARQIARKHGGDVVCERREGGGSCFILRIPISGEAR